MYEEKTAKKVLYSLFSINSVSCLFLLSFILLLKQMPLNVITVGQTKIDNINRMITITDDFNLLIFSKWDVQI